MQTIASVNLSPLLAEEGGCCSRGSTLRENTSAHVHSLEMFLKGLLSEETRDSGVCSGAFETACSFSSFVQEDPTKSYAFMVLLLRCYASAVVSIPEHEPLIHKTLKHLQVISDAEQVPLDNMLHHHRQSLLSEVRNGNTYCGFILNRLIHHEII